MKKLFKKYKKYKKFALFLALCNFLIVIVPIGVAVFAATPAPSIAPNVPVTTIPSVTTQTPAAIPTATPVPPLLEFNNSMIRNFNEQKAPIDMNIMKKNDVLQYFKASRKIGISFLVISIVCAIVALFFSGDIFTTAKIKLIIRDMLFSIFMLGTMYYWIGWAITGSNLFSQLWATDSSFTIGALLGSAGISVIAIILEPGLMVVVAIILVVCVLYQALMSSLIYLLEAAVIILPLLQALFPLKTFKKAYLACMSLVVTILMIFPIQNLFILLAKSTILNNTLSLSTLSSVLGLLIVICIVIPGAAIGAFTKIFNIVSNI